MIASDRAYQLADAISAMARRYADAEREAATHSVLHAVYKTAENAAERSRWQRAAVRRSRALYRLTAALRDLAPLCGDSGPGAAWCRLAAGHTGRHRDLSDWEWTNKADWT